MYQTCIPRNAADRTYIGASAESAARLVQHSSGLSRWTRGKGPWTLEWTSKPMSLGAARKLENSPKRQKGGAGLKKLKAVHGS